jgi:hypothetical protein
MVLYFVKVRNVKDLNKVGWSDLCSLYCVFESDKNVYMFTSIHVYFINVLFIGGGGEGSEQIVPHQKGGGGQEKGLHGSCDEQRCSTPLPVGILM